MLNLTDASLIEFNYVKRIKW